MHTYFRAQNVFTKQIKQIFIHGFPNYSMDEDKIEALFREVLKEIGIEENTEVLKNTPKRIARSYKEIFAKINQQRKICQKYSM